VEFREALEKFGFRRADERGMIRGADLYLASPNRFMTYMVHAYRDGSALFTWEFAIADYLKERGLQVGTAESDNQFLYPRQDVRGDQDGAWLAAAIDRTEAMLSAVHLQDPERS
jgi:hypothetical protein